MRIEAKAFVVSRRWDSRDVAYSALVNYTLRVVHELDGMDRAAVSGDVPLRCSSGGKSDWLLEKAMQERKVVKLTLEVTE